jgi:predicted PhzF superfamily epimerase YddE/YHI9
MPSPTYQIVTPGQLQHPVSAGLADPDTGRIVRQRVGEIHLGLWYPWSERSGAEVPGPWLVRGTRQLQPLQTFVTRGACALWLGEPLTGALLGAAVAGVRSLWVRQTVPQRPPVRQNCCFRKKEKSVRIPFYQIDAFTDRLFGGNPAAVCVLDSWLEDSVLQSIAAENNLSETAFLAGGNGRYRLRWFTPRVEVALCGHATLASAYVVFRELEPSLREVVFDSRSGELRVSREAELLTLDLPASHGRPCACPDLLSQGLGRRPLEVRRDTMYLCVFADEEDIRAVQPDFSALAGLDRMGVIVTAPGRSVDFVSRMFAPRVGIPEDPVTGSAHCLLTTYWAARTGKSRFTARQLSSRGGELQCELRGERVLISGRAVKYLQGEILL